MDRRNWFELQRKLVDKYDMDYTIDAFNRSLEKVTRGFFGEGVLVTTMYPNPFIITMSGVVFGGSVSEGYALDPNGQPVEIPFSTPTSKSFTVQPASLILPRWDLLVLRFAQTGDTPVPKPSDPIVTIDLNLHDDFELAVIEGTPSASPAYPAKGPNDIILAGLQTHSGDTIGTQIFVDLSIREIAQPFVPTFPVFIDEVPAGAVDGVNTTFTLSETPITSGSLIFFVDDIKLKPSEYSLAGNVVTLTTPPAPAQSVQAWYIELSPMSQNPLVAFNLAIGTGDGVTTDFSFSGRPISKSCVMVYSNGLKVPASDWDLVEVDPSTSKIHFHTAPPAAYDIDVVFFVNSESLGIGPSGSGVQTVTNEGVGAGQVAIGISANDLQLRNLKAGANTTITQNSTDIIISSSGGGGPSGYANQGDESAPVTVIPASGITPTSDPLQTWYIKGPTSGGRQNVTATPQIAAGVAVGQRLAMLITDAVDYPAFQDGNGLSLNGVWPSIGGPIQYAKIELEWTGLRWAEVSRK